MGFAEYRQAAARELEPVLAGLLRDWSDQVQAQSGGALASLTEAFAGSVAGGKMVRGTLVRLGAQLGGGQPSPAVLQAAAAFELLHSAFLIHDDIMDRSLLRRGRPTVHQAVGGGHYGLSQGICLGDAGYFLAMRTLAGLDLEPAVRSAALAYFSQIALDTVTGQMLDAQYSQPHAPKEAAAVIRIHDLKAAAYTIIGPLTLGALLAAAPPPQLAAIARYGRGVGLAFQIHDDILGIFADAAATGKSVTSDIAENKNTLLITYALEHADAAQRAALLELYGQADLSAAQVARVKRIFETTGALEHSRQTAARYVEDSRAVIPEITADPQLQELLRGLADFTIGRSK